MYQTKSFASLWEVITFLGCQMVFNASFGHSQSTWFTVTDVITWVSAAILVVLFFFQSYGTDKVSFLFSPVMALWLLTTPMVGIYNIVIQYPKVFKAFSPYYIYTFFQKNGKEGWMMLGGVVLCITGMSSWYSLRIVFCFNIRHLVRCLKQKAMFWRIAPWPSP